MYYADTDPHRLRVTGCQDQYAWEFLLGCYRCIAIHMHLDCPMTRDMVRPTDPHCAFFKARDFLIMDVS